MLNLSENNQVAQNIKPGKILSITLKNGKKVNGRFTVYKKYNDNSKFLDIAETENHFLLYDFKIGDYVVIVKNNIARIAANKQVILL